MSKKYHELEDDDYEHRSENIDGKIVYFKTAVSEMTEQEFTNLSEDDCEFIFNCLMLADTLLKTHSPGNDFKNFTPDILDNLIDLWNENSNQFDCTENGFVNSIGVAFGHYLNKFIGSKWTIITDEYGSDFSCQIDEINLRAFPLSSVLKAIEQNREGSLDQIYLLLKHQKQELENDNK